jgi:hypothetical protein
MFELSDHATIRCEERKLPDTVLERIQRGTYVAQALEDDGRISNLHIVRVATDHYWVAIERDAVVVTVILVGFEGSSAREWFSRRLLNPSPHHRGYRVTPGHEQSRLAIDLNSLLRGEARCLYMYS